MKKIKFLTVLMTLSFAIISTTAFSQTTQKDVTIIELAQVPGEFETVDLNLKPGKYQFRIVNKSVDKEVGFVIQKAADKSKDFMKTMIPNSGAQSLMKKGEVSYTGIVDLTAGEYVYSCPLNPTPHYAIHVD